MRKIIYRIFPPKKIENKTVKKLGRYLKFGNRITRIKASHALRLLNSDSIPNILKEGLQDKEYYVMVNSAIGLARYKYPNIEKYLLDATKSKYNEDKLDIAKYLKYYNYEPLVDFVIDCLNTEFINTDFIINSVDSLSKIKNKKAINTIVNIVKKEVNSWPSDEVINYSAYDCCINSLKEIDCPDVIPFIIEVFNEKAYSKLLSSLKILMSQSDFNDFLLDHFRDLVNIKIRKECLIELKKINWKPNNLKDIVLYKIFGDHSPHQLNPYEEKLKNLSIDEHSILVNQIESFLNLLEEKYSFDTDHEIAKIIWALSYLKNDSTSKYLLRIYPKALGIVKKYNLPIRGKDPKSNLIASIEETYMKINNHYIRLDTMTTLLLIEQLKHNDAKIRKDAANILEERKWKPKSLDEKVPYFYAKYQWDKLQEIGRTEVIDILIESIKSNTDEIEVPNIYGKELLDGLLKKIKQENKQTHQKLDLVKILLRFDTNLSREYRTEAMKDMLMYITKKDLSYHEKIDIANILLILGSTKEYELETLEEVLSIINIYEPGLSIYLNKDIIIKLQKQSKNCKLQKSLFKIYNKAISATHEEVIDTDYYYVNSLKKSITQILQLLETKHHNDIAHVLHWTFFNDTTSTWIIPLPRGHVDLPFVMKLEILKYETIQKAFRHQFKDYFDIIYMLNNVTLEKVITEGTGDTHTTYFEIENPIINDLCQIHSDISNNLLNLVSARNDLEAWYRDDMDFDHYHCCSFKYQREVAQSELIRRGNPKYNSEYYGIESNWLINSNERTNPSSN